MDTEVCVGCENPFRPGSKPRWIFTTDARLVGRAHTTCSVASKGWRPFPSSNAWRLDDAQFWAWLWWVKGKAKTEFERDVRLLAYHPADGLDGEQDHTLTGWIRGKRQMTFREAVERAEAHTVLIHEFQAWRAEIGSVS